MPKAELGSNNNEHTLFHRVREGVIFTGAIAKELGIGISHLPELFRGIETEKDRKARIRREYKYSLLKPFFRKLPTDVI